LRHALGFRAAEAALDVIVDDADRLPEGVDLGRPEEVQPFCPPGQAASSCGHGQRSRGRNRPARVRRLTDELRGRQPTTRIDFTAAIRVVK
jgi:hypothetical protein